MEKRRVVITGMGLVSPLGNTVEETFSNMIKGVNGIDVITQEDVSNWKVKLAGEVKNLNFEDFLEKKKSKEATVHPTYRWLRWLRLHRKQT